MKVPFRNKATVGAGLLAASALLLSACGGGGAGAGNAPAEESGDVEVVEESAGEDTANCGEGMTVGVAMPTQTSERWIADGQAVEDVLRPLASMSTSNSPTMISLLRRNKSTK